jgi:hypothetical protein
MGRGASPVQKPVSLTVPAAPPRLRLVLTRAGRGPFPEPSSRNANLEGVRGWAQSLFSSLVVSVCPSAYPSRRVKNVEFGFRFAPTQQQS